MSHAPELDVTGMAGLSYNLTRITLAVRDARQVMARVPTRVRMVGLAGV